MSRENTALRLTDAKTKEAVLVNPTHIVTLRREKDNTAILLSNQIEVHVVETFEAIETKGKEYGFFKIGSR